MDYDSNETSYRCLRTGTGLLSIWNKDIKKLTDIFCRHFAEGNTTAGRLKRQITIELLLSFFKYACVVLIYSLVATKQNTPQIQTREPTSLVNGLTS